MESARLITFVLPVFDEEGNLRELHEKIVAAMDARPERYEMVFVDDGSRDRSVEVLEQLRQSDRRVRIVQLRRNFGKAAAYSAGFHNARGDVIITMDTDLQDDPAEIPLFLDQIYGGFDMVVGWKHEGKGPMGKSLPSRFFNRVVKWITGIALNDFNCPFKAYRAAVLREIQVYGELHRYIPVLANARGFTMTEVKIKNLPRKSGSSKYGLERYARGMLDLLTISFITRFARRPMHLIGFAGVLACLVGGGIVGTFVLGHVLFLAGIVTNPSWNIHDRPALTLGVLMAVVGVQMFSIGLLGELMVTKSGGDRRGDRGYSVKRILEDQADE